MQLTEKEIELKDEVLKKSNEHFHLDLQSFEYLNAQNSFENDFSVINKKQKEKNTKKIKKKKEKSDSFVLTTELLKYI